MTDEQTDPPVSGEIVGPEGDGQWESVTIPCTNMDTL